MRSLPGTTLLAANGVYLKRIEYAYGFLHFFAFYPTDGRREFVQKWKVLSLNYPQYLLSFMEANIVDPRVLE